ncbi:pyrroline-5-carboxylate reductase [Clostridium sp. MB40-C1]|uniref:pyrroline-5-carboxylate reductase n=1 Tax=Clostridium sp. MB40-C1 TaxID=3070996 RepID=UPI0027E0AAA4|nr:pyrroline-5-carboxylate reductase [Clostridium sp. MB40-C1]WMJ80111.1 pyrroline-5-carboxylate reductase [Clostridium sp. MB40-C1]
MQSKIGFIGCGNMAGAMIRGIVNSNLISPECIIASNPTKEKLTKIKEETDIMVTQDNLEVAKFSNIIVLAVKPNKYKDVIEEIKNNINEDTIIITIAAGINIAKAEELFGWDIKLIRTMPNTPALVGEGMSALCKNEYVTEEDMKKVMKIFKCFGKVEVVEEKDIDTIIGLTGSSPAYVYMFIEALADGAVLKGLPRQKAYKLAAQAVYGSAKMVLETGKHPGELKDDVCSPGGTTIEAVYSLEKSGFRASVMEAMDTCIEKAKNMNK